MTTISVKLSDLPLAQLIQLNQGCGREIDALREKRAHLNTLIAARIAAGESEHAEPGDASAPGAVIDTQTK